MGSNKTDFQPIEEIDPPDDRLLTIRVTERITSIHSGGSRTIDTVFQSTDAALLDSVISQFGERPPGT